jgi:hypothetical protein
MTDKPEYYVQIRPQKRAGRRSEREQPPAAAHFLEEDLNEAGVRRTLPRVEGEQFGEIGSMAGRERKIFAVTHLRPIMLEELERRNYAQTNY